MIATLAEVDTMAVICDIIVSYSMTPSISTANSDRTVIVDIIVLVNGVMGITHVHSINVIVMDTVILDQIVVTSSGNANSDPEIIVTID